MKFVEIDFCEECGKDMKPKTKGICFECNAHYYHYVCKKCFKKLEDLK